MLQKQRAPDEMSEGESHYMHGNLSYGGRYMTEPLPKYRMPEHATASSVAYRLIRDEVGIDGRPAQNLATFCTTWMEPEADKLIAEGVQYNLADEDEYPHVLEIQTRCVSILGELFHAQMHEGGAVGTATIGSSEAMMLAGLALKFRWRDARKKAGLSTDKPNLVMAANVQICWKKFCRYFDVEPRLMPLAPDRHIATAQQVADAVDENTIGVCAVVGSTFTGEFEPVTEINDTLMKINKEKGWDIPIHVDGASGAFVAPFLYPDLEWDFRVPLVRSINVSGHKYGLCYPGIGWVVWRSEKVLPEELIFKVNYLGGEMKTFTLNFSRPASGVLAQYYNFLRLGREGYTRVMQGLKANSDYIRDEIGKMSCFRLLGDAHSLPLVAWACTDDAPFTAFDLSDKLRQRGWIVPAYTMPKNAENVACLRSVIREGMSRNMCDSLVRDIHWAVDGLSQPGEREVTESVVVSRKHDLC